MIINHAKLSHTAVWASQFPTSGLPEIAFAGKSNVGKSSLINAMLSRKSLARISGTPGKTRTINFYEVEKKLYFVDLPGYGYARVSKSESAKWGGMVEGYLKGRHELKAVLLLVDIRHEVGPNDLMLYDWFLHHGVRAQVVATKSDKIGKGKMQKHLATIKKGLSLESPPLPFSSKSKNGREELWNYIIDNIGGGVLQ